MKVEIKYNSWIPRLLRRNAITLYPKVLISKTKKEAKRRHILNHEWIHVLQIRKEDFLKFYLNYLGEWFCNLFKCFNRAYLNISYEKEAYSKQDTIKLPKKLK